MSNKLLILTIFLLVGIDQITKFVFYDNRFCSDCLLFTASFNHGIAWSLPVPLFFVIVFSFAFLVFLILFFRKGFFSPFVVLFVFSGNVGNLIDRILYYGVRDFIDLGFFPIFNLADVYLTIGVIFMFYFLFVSNNDGQTLSKM